MSEFNRHQSMIAKVAEALGDELLQRMAFVGGCTTGFFITDDFSRQQIRYTNDIDIIVHVLGLHGWAQLQERLRKSLRRLDRGTKSNSSPDLIVGLHRRQSNLRVLH